MKITDIFAQKRVTVSCELFPPKEGGRLTEAKEIARSTAALGPDFISVTYGAAGGAHNHTIDIADEIENRAGVPALTHLTCMGATRGSVREVLAEMRRKGLQNILALRGDLPDGASTGDFAHASDLIGEIHACGDFCVGAACYPEGHPESPSQKADLDALQRKAACGVSFLTTQMFFDNNILYNFLFKLYKRGVEVPIVAGIMPVVNARQTARICRLSGTLLPPRFKAIVDRFADQPAAMRQAGIAYATEQIVDLLANGVEHIHIYTMNRPDIAQSILQNISALRG